MSNILKGLILGVSLVVIVNSANSSDPDQIIQSNQTTDESFQQNKIADTNPENTQKSEDQFIKTPRDEIAEIKDSDTDYNMKNYLQNEKIKRQLQQQELQERPDSDYTLQKNLPLRQQLLEKKHINELDVKPSSMRAMKEFEENNELRANNPISTSPLRNMPKENMDTIEETQNIKEIQQETPQPQTAPEQTMDKKQDLENNKKIEEQKQKETDVEKAKELDALKEQNKQYQENIIKTNQDLKDTVKQLENETKTLKDKVSIGEKKLEQQNKALKENEELKKENEELKTKIFDAVKKVKETRENLKELEAIEIKK